MNIAMNNHQLEKFLKSRGFEKKRRGKHGWIWNDGVSNVQIAGSPSDYRSMRNSLQEVERAYKLRLLTEGEKSKPKKEESEVRKILNNMPATKPPGLISVQATQDSEPMANGADHGKKPRISYSKLDSVTRFKVMTLCKQLHEQGKSTTDMAIIVEAAGFRDTGGKIIPQRFITKYVRSMMEDGTIQQVVHAPAAVVPTPAPTQAAPATATWEIVPTPTPALTPVTAKPTEAGVVDGAVKITAPSARKLPHWAVSILTDPDLTNNEKIQMLTAMSEIR